MEWKGAIIRGRDGDVRALVVVIGKQGRVRSLEKSREMTKVSIGPWASRPRGEACKLSREEALQPTPYSRLLSLGHKQKPSVVSQQCRRILWQKSVWFVLTKTDSIHRGEHGKISKHGGDYL